ncbi:MAG: type II secretion system F family protein [Patescibacteria group bacterium]
MKFSYSAKNDKGEIQSGLIEVFSEEAAIDLLQKANLVILKIERRREDPWYLSLAASFQKVSLKEVAVFTRQLATLFEAQVSITESLQTVYNQTTHPALREAIFDVYSDIEAGMPLSDALSKHSRIFSSFYINMIKAAELTGRLDSALNYLADYYDSQSVIQTKIRNAMIYPIFLIVLFAVVIGIMIVVVIPQLGGVILESGLTLDQLPLMTRILFATGTFLQKYYLLAAGFFFGGLFLFLKYFSSEEGQLLLSTLLLNTPVLGGFLKKVFVSRFAETFGVLLKGNIPVAQSLEISADVVGSIYYQEAIDEIAQGVRQGANISDLLLQYPEYFPPLVSQMVAVGEKTGKLEELLAKVSKFYTREVEALVNSLTEIIQPVLIVLLGVLVGGLIAAVILPIYQIAQQF